MRKLLQSAVFILFFAGMLSGVVGCNKTRPLLIPSFEAQSSNSSVISKAIRVSLLKRGWSILSDKPGRIEATYRKGGEAAANIAVTYKGKQVKIEHLSSTNLLYGQDQAGTPVIHRTYNNWMIYLERDIQTEIARNS